MTTTKNLPLRQNSTHDLFDHCQGDIRIEENGFLAVHHPSINSSGYGIVRGRNSYSLDTRRIRFRFETQNHSQWSILIGIVSYERILLKPKHSSFLYGWLISNVGVNTTKQSQQCVANVMDLQPNDIFGLTIDCENQLIELINERSQCKYILMINVEKCSKPWQLEVQLYWPGNQVRLIRANNDDCQLNAIDGYLVQTDNSSRSTDNSKLSPLYLACRVNDVASVCYLLDKLTPAQINYIEPNGSTALHVACYYGYVDIVVLLLEHGAYRSIRHQIYNTTPYEETSNPAIKKLFSRKHDQEDRPETIARTDSTSISWNRANWLNAFLRQKLRQHDVLSMIEYIKEHYISRHAPQAGLNAQDQQQIEWFYDFAILESDPRYLLQACTSATTFYKIMNRHFVEVFSKKLSADSLATSMYYLAALFKFSPHICTLEFAGETFRGMVIDRNLLETYQIGNIVVNKALVSTSKSRTVAEICARRNPRNHFRPNRQHGNIPVHVSLLCRYHIRGQNCEARDLGNLSEIPDEEEVLIMALCPFRISQIRQPSNFLRNTMVEIDLEEYQRVTESFGRRHSQIGDDEKHASPYSESGIEDYSELKIWRNDFGEI